LTPATPPWRLLSVDSGRGGEILVADLDARSAEDGPCLIVALGFHACVDPFELQRFRLIAERLHARLVVVETPGFGSARSRLLPGERAALRRGDFVPMARRMLKAALTVTDTPNGLIGYSLGTSTAAAMAAVANASSTIEFGPRLGTLVLVEPVAVRPWRLNGLVSAVRWEDRWIPQHVAENQCVEGAVPPAGGFPQTRRRLDLALLANALRKAALPGNVLTASPHLDHVIVIRGDRSRISRSRDLAVLLQTLSLAEIRATVIRASGPHAFWQSLPRVTAITDELAELLKVA
jgi:pimeloyl-ACP methyl ester carboxylesterase